MTEYFRKKKFEHQIQIPQKYFLKALRLFNSKWQQDSECEIAKLGTSELASTKGQRDTFSLVYLS